MLRLKSLGAKADCNPTDGPSTRAARLIQPEMSIGAGSRGVAGCASRSRDEAPPRQLGAIGRLRRAFGMACWRFSGMATTSLVFAIRRAAAPLLVRMWCLHQRNVCAMAAAADLARSATKNAALQGAARPKHGQYVTGLLRFRRVWSRRNDPQTHCIGNTPGGAARSAAPSRDKAAAALHCLPAKPRKLSMGCDYTDRNTNDERACLESSTTFTNACSKHCGPH